MASLISALDDKVDIGLRNAAGRGPLCRHRARGRPGPAIQALADLDPDGRKLAIEVLGGVPDVPARMSAPRGRSTTMSPNVRASAAEALGGARHGWRGSARAEATGALVSWLSSAESFVTVAALDALGRLEARLPWTLFEPFVTDPVLRRYATIAQAASARRASPTPLRRSRAPRPIRLADGVARGRSCAGLGDVLAGGFDDASLAPGIRAGPPRARRRPGRRQAAARRYLALDLDDARGRGGALLVLGLMRASARTSPTLALALDDDDVAERADLALRMFGALRRRAARRRGPRGTALHARRRPLARRLDERRRRGPRALLVAALRDALQGHFARGRSLRRRGPREEWGDDGADLQPRSPRMVGHADERLAAASSRATSDIASRHVEAARELLRDSSPAHDPVALGCVLLGAIASVEPLQEGELGSLARARRRPRRPSGPARGRDRRPRRQSGSRRRRPTWWPSRSPTRSTTSRSRLRARSAGSDGPRRSSASSSDTRDPSTRRRPRCARSATPIRRVRSPRPGRS